MPKFELEPILIYLIILPKTFLPSTTPSSSAVKSFSKRIVSAVSFVISSALFTEMPASSTFNAGASFNNLFRSAFCY